MLFNPYIGITDFTHFGQVMRMLGVLRTYYQPGQIYRLHVGVMMSYKTLHGIETKWSKVFPAAHTIADIFGSDETMNCLHYVDYDAIDVIASLRQAIAFGGYGINALQLDMVWPDPEQVAVAVANSSQSLEVILQIGENALSLVNHSPQSVVDRIRTYIPLVQHVLLDKSMGRGIGLDAVGLVPFVVAIRKAFPDLGISVAGGLGPDSIDLVAPLVRKFPGLSIDAQSKLRPSGNALDPIDWNMAEQYLIRGLRLLK